MKTLLKYLSLTVLAAFLASPALAEDSPRFSADDFLKEWNVFLDEEEKSAKADQKDTGFLYFKTDMAPTGTLKLQDQTAAPVPFTPRKTMLTGNLENVVLPGETWLLNTFTPRFAGAEFSFGFGKENGDENAGPKFDISLSSQVSSKQTNIFGAVNNDFVLEALNRQIYDFGLDVGYSGFTLGASLRGEEGAYFDGISGYDIGLSYNRPTWSTSLLVGGYRQGNNIMFGLNNGIYNDMFFAVELGAAYKLAPWFKFVGSFRYYQDANLLLLNPDGGFTNRMFYLGTKLRF